ncbi:MAG: hypothetical protein BIFFINMI_01584 [Phycisphaerae bacterium]|nr:hypothetical protein [Phycisphaerae bacterium]
MRRTCAGAAALAVLAVILAQPAQAAIQSAAADDSNDMYTFGSAVSEVVSNGASYAGVGSQATSTVNGPGGGPLLGTTVEILAGTNNSGSGATVQFAWRTRTQAETFTAEGGSPTEPPLLISQGVFGLCTDVVEISGVGAGDVFVLQMSYDDYGGAIFDEAVEAANGCIHLNWLNPNGGGEGVAMWENAVLGNNGTNVGVQNYQGSWDDAGQPMDLGAWGVDTVNNVIWAVLDHNSQFAAAPEPATMLLLGLGGMGLLARGTRRRRQGR